MSGAAKLPFEWKHVTIFFGNSVVHDLSDCVPVLVCEDVSNVYVLGAVELFVEVLRLFHKVIVFH